MKAEDFVVQTTLQWKRRNQRWSILFAISR